MVREPTRLNWTNESIRLATLGPEWLSSARTSALAGIQFACAGEIIAL
jgi:hypothetical protein